MNHLGAQLKTQHCLQEGAVWLWGHGAAAYRSCLKGNQDLSSGAPTSACSRELDLEIVL